MKKKQHLSKHLLHSKANDFLHLLHQAIEGLLNLRPLHLGILDLRLHHLGPRKSMQRLLLLLCRLPFHRKPLQAMDRLPHLPVPQMIDLYLCLLHERIMFLHRLCHLRMQFHILQPRLLCHLVADHHHRHHQCHL